MVPYNSLSIYNGDIFLTLSDFSDVLSGSVYEGTTRVVPTEWTAWRLPQDPSMNEGAPYLLQSHYEVLRKMLSAKSDTHAPVNGGKTCLASMALNRALMSMALANPANGIEELPDWQSRITTDGRDPELISWFDNSGGATVSAHGEVTTMGVTSLDGDLYSEVYIKFYGDERDKCVVPANGLIKLEKLEDTGLLAQPNGYDTQHEITLLGGTPGADGLVDSPYGAWLPGSNGKAPVNASVGMTACGDTGGAGTPRKYACDWAAKATDTNKGRLLWEFEFGALEDSTDTDPIEFDMIVVYCDVFNIDGTAMYKHVPMGVYFPGKWKDTGEHRVAVYPGQSLNLRIAMKLGSTPATTVVEANVLSDSGMSDMFEVISSFAGKIGTFAETAELYNEQKQALLSEMRSSVATLQTASTVNVPYVAVINGTAWWFVNGRNTGQKVMADSTSIQEYIDALMAPYIERVDVLDCKTTEIIEKWETVLGWLDVSGTPQPGDAITWTSGGKAVWRPQYDRLDYNNAVNELTVEHQAEGTWEYIGQPLWWLGAQASKRTLTLKATQQPGLRNSPEQMDITLGTVSAVFGIMKYYESSAGWQQDATSLFGDIQGAMVAVSNGDGTYSTWGRETSSERWVKLSGTIEFDSIRYLTQSGVYSGEIDVYDTFDKTHSRFTQTRGGEQYWQNYINAGNTYNNLNDTTTVAGVVSTAAVTPAAVSAIIASNALVPSKTNHSNFMSGFRLVPGLVPFGALISGESYTDKFDDHGWLCGMNYWKSQYFAGVLDRVYSPVWYGGTDTTPEDVNNIGFSMLLRERTSKIAYGTTDGRTFKKYNVTPLAGGDTKEYFVPVADKGVLDKQMLVDTTDSSGNKINYPQGSSLVTTGALAEALHDSIRRRWERLAIEKNMMWPCVVPLFANRAGDNKVNPDQWKYDDLHAVSPAAVHGLVDGYTGKATQEYVREIVDAKVETSIKTVSTYPKLVASAVVLPISFNPHKYLEKYKTDTYGAGILRSSIDTGLSTKSSFVTINTYNAGILRSSIDTGLSTKSSFVTINTYNADGTYIIPKHRLTFTGDTGIVSSIGQWYRLQNSILAGIVLARYNSFIVSTSDITSPKYNVVVKPIKACWKYNDEINSGSPEMFSDWDYNSIKSVRDDVKVLHENKYYAFDNIYKKLVGAGTWGGSRDTDVQNEQQVLCTYGEGNSKISTLSELIGEIKMTSVLAQLDKHLYVHDNQLTRGMKNYGINSLSDTSKMYGIPSILYNDTVYVGMQDSSDGGQVGIVEVFIYQNYE